MKITVIGPGAIGMLLGTLLEAAGHEVVFRGRGPARKTPRGIRVVLPDRWVSGKPSRRPGPGEASGPADVVLVTLGRHHLRAARRPDFQRLVGPGQGPVAFMNTGGPDMERLGTPAARRNLCLSLLTAVTLQDDDVALAPGRSVLVHETSPVLAECFSSLPKWGIQVLAVQDAQPLARSLLVLQLLSLPVAMCNATLDSFLASGEGRQIAQSILAEGFAALDRAGLAVSPLPVMDPRELLTRLERRPGSFAAGALAPDQAYNTVLRSFLRGRPTEASHLNRRIVEIASSAGLHLSWNWRLFQKASRIAGPGFYRDPADLLRSLQ